MSNNNLVNILKNFNEKIYYLPNPGNAGDSLICCATILFFENHKISFEVIRSIHFDGRDKVVVYGGGGNFGGSFSRVAKFIQQYHKQARALILLPHTIFGAEELLESLGTNCYLFCRENISYEHIKSHAKNANVFLQDDMVFICDVRALMNYPHRPQFIKHLSKKILYRLTGRIQDDLGIGLKGYLNFCLFKLKKLLRNKAYKSKTLNAFRTDHEKTGISIPRDNIDLSAVLELSACIPGLAFRSAITLLKEIDRYDVIKTNRLHIAIAAILLGKEVHIYANNYFKIRAIYEYSIMNRFNNVFWGE